MSTATYETSTTTFESSTFESVDHDDRQRDADRDNRNIERRAVSTTTAASTATPKTSTVTSETSSVEGVPDGNRNLDRDAETSTATYETSTRRRASNALMGKRRTSIETPSVTLADTRTVPSVTPTAAQRCNINDEADAGRPCLPDGHHGNAIDDADAEIEARNNDAQ